MPKEMSHPYQIHFKFKGYWAVRFNFIQIFLFANSAEPDQMPRSVPSDLVLLCFAMSHKQYTRLKWIKGQKANLGL